MRTKKKYSCPCCGEFDFDTPPGGHDICQICGWEDDGVQFDNPNFKPGANEMSLNEARRIWASGRAIWQDYPNPKQNRRLSRRKAIAVY